MSTKQLAQTRLTQASSPKSLVHNLCNELQHSILAVTNSILQILICFAIHDMTACSSTMPMVLWLQNYAHVNLMKNLLYQNLIDPMNYGEEIVDNKEERPH